MGKTQRFHLFVNQREIPVVFFCLIAILIFPLSISFYTTCCAIGFLLVRFRRIHCVLWLGSCLAIAYMMMWTPPYNSVKNIEGTVVGVNSGSILVSSKQGTFQVSTTQSFHLDDQIFVEGTSSPIENQASFFGFQIEQWAKQKRLSGRIYAKSAVLIRHSSTLRHTIHQQLLKVPSVKIQSLWLKLILGVKSQSDKSWDLLYHCGFHYGLLLYWLKRTSQYFFQEKTANKIHFVALLAISIILRFPVALCRLWFKEFVKLIQCENKLTRCCLEYGIFACLFPHYVSSAVFLFPCVFSFYHCLHQNKTKDKSMKLTVTILLQGWLFSEVSWGMIIAMPILRRFLALSTVLGLVGLFIPSICYLIEPVFLGLEYLEKFPVWYGKPNIILCLFLVLLLILSQCKKKQLILLISICILYLGGLWYPFSSVTLINVQQGDSILIRLPFNQGNILVDTGKHSAYSSLRSALRGRGITKIDLLVITHDDQDHSGNIESLNQDFKIKQTVEKQEGSWTVKNLTLHSISPRSGQGESNEGSLILFTQINRVRLLLMGDAPKETEALLIQKHPGLKADILKLGHHGSDTSTSDALLVALRPVLAINSSGLHNRYGHPSQKVVQRLDQYRIGLLDTQTSGEIQITFTYFFNFFFTAEKQFGIMNEVIS